MVSQKYRWDFIGLSTDEKPTSETSDKVVNGSTYYCSDTSKLYVYCDGTWYERKPLGGGGGGGTSDFNDLSNRPKYNGSDMTGSTNIPEVKTYTAGSNVAISDQNVISATDTTYTAGTNVSISDQNVISATDTTYSAFTGTDGTAAGAAGLVPAPATTDAGKFLKADGTWDTAGGGSGPTVVQTTGTSTTDVMSQNATTSMVYSPKTTSNSANSGAVYIGGKDATNQVLVDPTTTDNHYKYFWALPVDGTVAPPRNSVNIMGLAKSDYASYAVSILSSGTNQYSVAIGDQAWAEGSNSVSLGRSSHSRNNAIAIGQEASAQHYCASMGAEAGKQSDTSLVSCVNLGFKAGANQPSGTSFSVNLGACSRGTRQGEVNVGLVTGNTTSGYNGTAYRVIGGVHDGQLAHDAATVGQITPLSDSSAPTTATVGRLGQIQIDTTTATAYMCVAVDTVTPSYTWKKITA